MTTSTSTTLPGTDFHHPVSMLDARTLAGLAQLDPSGANNLVQRVLRTYISSLQRLREQLEIAHDGLDLPGVRLASHTLKSSSASVGALQLSALCAAVEQAARDQQTQELPALVQSLLAEAGRVDTAVRQMLPD